ncbi:pyridoxamine 5'-phosphate oxidase family protein [Micromonospora foliorum]|uniref:pyridoxamine 5'-phosphate oxidase family protein n=1 Tax=Micromonospora foliorum TaxID=2911210 RepID=UPI001EE9A8D2|nr:pyridoxamine 5'-phosphate oxidase family protein [Micromonospora foliorum]MCG5440762.1 pyridoxamine 5'-phosphate oxidase family protein [Micromonospora foliorum]
MSLPQGDLKLLDTPLARRLLAASLVARLAYTGRDGTPRLIPVNFLWTGDELVVGAFAGNYKIRDLSARPDVAVCIDTADGLPEVLMLRGTVTLAEVEGVLPEYATIQRAGMGDEVGNAYLTAIDKPGLRMVRIGLRPTWVGVVDFQGRFPARTPEPVRAALSGGQ